MHRDISENALEANKSFHQWIVPFTLAGPPATVLPYQQAPILVLSRRSLPEDSPNSEISY